MNDNELYHYGVPRRSGRYPWGSGKESYQRTGDFLSRIDEFKKQGMSERDIADAFGLTTTKFRAQQSMAKAERRADQVSRAVSLREKGMSLNEIAKEMGFNNDSSVRSLLNERSMQRMDEAINVANLLKKHIDEKGMIDIGAGIERELGVSKEKMTQAVHMLEMQGYPNYSGGVDQVTNAGKRTTLKVIGPPGTEHKDIYDYSKVHTITDYNTATGDVEVKTFRYPTSVDLKRIHIRYAEDGGQQLDGTIELRRGVPDLNLGGSHYSQVRILAGEKSYLKGMAVYKDDDNFPPGVDIVFNTNKKRGTPPEKVFKSVEDNLKKDPTNPFGSLIGPKGQSEYLGKDGKMHLSAINKRADEGDWNEWKKGLPSQFLAKQSKEMIKRQLGLSKADKLAELEEIMSITNPTVKKNLLASFADDADAAAVHLKAAALPRQKYQVILPIPSLKDTECYAPNFADGEQLALVRFPHGGRFEIPIVTVNNKNKDAKSTITPNAKDAIGINSNVAERLSGADFDGDTVLAIPVNSKTKVLTQSPLEGLKGFDNKAEFPARPGMKVMPKSSIGREMGVISNLITDMTLRGATEDEMARAVRHSMVVIDAYKHKLDYKRSEEVNGIAALKKRYQTTIDADGNEHTGGASTLLSRAKGDIRVEKRVGTPKVNLKGKPWYDPNEEEGALLYNRVENKKGTPHYDPNQPEGKYITRAPETYVDSKGKTQVRTQTSSKMLEARDARSLSSGTIQEELYADYANSLKSMANTARKALATTGNLKYSPEAKKEYSVEVARLNAKLNTALLNAPRERQAQLLANSIVKAKKADNPDMEPEQLKKIKQAALTEARTKFGAHRETIKIDDREWEAIQKGAVSENVLQKIIQNADIDSLREKATPRQKVKLNQAKLNLLQSMKASGYTNDEIAKRLGVSSSLVAKY